VGKEEKEWVGVEKSKLSLLNYRKNWAYIYWAPTRNQTNI